MGERGSEERRAEFERRIAGIRRAEIRIGEDLPARKGRR